MVFRRPFIFLLLLSLCCTQLPQDNGILARIVTGSGAMKYLPGGSFTMGSIIDSSALPIRNVTVSPFYIDSTEVTQGQYVALLHVNPSYHPAESDLPAENMTWFDALLFCNARSNAEGFDTVYRYDSISGNPGNGCTDLKSLMRDTSRNGYRLPTEAEWEYACRAGTNTLFFWGNDTVGDTLSRYSWNTNNALLQTHAAAGKLPNAWGLYDMSGNVGEWCEDWFLKGYSTNDTLNPAGPASAFGSRVVRGGSFVSYVGYLTSGARGASFPATPWADRGFRCVRR
jgi:formylglycine-generating enzyme required for sulfatase activity